MSRIAVQLYLLRKHNTHACATAIPFLIRQLMDRNIRIFMELFDSSGGDSHSHGGMVRLLLFSLGFLNSDSVILNSDQE